MMLFVRSFILWVLLVILCVVIANAQQLPPFPFSIVKVHDPVNKQHTLSQGLVFFWRVVSGLDGGGTWYDLMNRQNGTLVNMTTAGTSGWGGSTRYGSDGELRFDGFNDYVDLGVNGIGRRVIGASAVTIAMWVKYTSLASGDNIVFLELLATDSTALRINLPSATPGKVTVGGRSIWSDSFQEVTSSGTLSSGTWNHVVAVVDYAGDTIAIYINGKLDVTTGVTFTNTTYDNTPGDSPDVLGANFVGIYGFVGMLDECMVYNKALLSGDIRQLYDESTQGHPTLLNRADVNTIVQTSNPPPATGGGFAPFFQR